MGKAYGEGNTPNGGWCCCIGSKQLVLCTQEKEGKGQNKAQTTNHLLYYLSASTMPMGPTGKRCPSEDSTASLVALGQSRTPHGPPLRIVPAVSSKQQINAAERVPPFSTFVQVLLRQLLSQAIVPRPLPWIQP